MTTSTLQPGTIKEATAGLVVLPPENINAPFFISLAIIFTFAFTALVLALIAFFRK